MKNHLKTKESFSLFHTAYLLVLALGGLLTVFLAKNSNLLTVEQSVYILAATIPISLLVSNIGSGTTPAISIYGPTTVAKSSLYVTAILCFFASIATTELQIIGSVTLILLVALVIGYRENKRIGLKKPMPKLLAVGLPLYVIASLVVKDNPEILLIIVGVIFACLIFYVLRHSLIPPIAILYVFAMPLGVFAAGIIILPIMLLTGMIFDIDNGSTGSDNFYLVFFILYVILALVLAFNPRILFGKLFDRLEKLDADRAKSKAKKKNGKK